MVRRGAQAVQGYPSVAMQWRCERYGGVTTYRHTFAFQADFLPVFFLEKYLVFETCRNISHINDDIQENHGEISAVDQPFIRLVASQAGTPEPFFKMCAVIADQRRVTYLIGKNIQARQFESIFTNIRNVQLVKKVEFVIGFYRNWNNWNIKQCLR